MCHHSESSSSNLCYYPESKSLYCFVCGENWNIFSFVQYIKNCSFPESLQYITQLCGIKCDEITQSSTIIRDDWKKLLKFIPNSNHIEENKIYDKNVLKLFEDWQHEYFINDGISIETCKKYHIGFYKRLQQISIPIFEDNNLVGVQCRNTIKSLENKAKYDVFRDINNNEYKFSTSGVLYSMDDLHNKDIILVEGIKSSLQLDTMKIPYPSIPLFGMNCNKNKRDKILKYEPKSITISIDKMYHSVYNEDMNFTEEFIEWQKKVMKIVKMFKGYCDVYIMWDDGDLVKYKQSMTDNGLEIWNKLWNKRRKI